MEKLEFKGTNGKWYQMGNVAQVEDGTDSCVEIRNEDQLLICVMKFGGFMQSLSSEADTNAKLIAAAPDLLEALQRTVRDIDDIETTRDLKGTEISIRERAKKAIEKALK